MVDGKKIRIRVRTVNAIYVGDIIVRGGNPLDPAFGQGPGRGAGRIDHISFGIAPWDTDAVKAELEKRGLRAQIDTSSRHPDATGRSLDQERVW